MSDYKPTINTDEVPEGQNTIHVALVSGGMDSAVAASVAYETANKIDFFAYLDTGTGLQENEDYVKELARHHGVQPWILGTHEDYEEWVQEQGFPGPALHSTAYRKLKERQLGKLATLAHPKELVLWSGVRSAESKRRSLNVEPIDDAPRWKWVSPIHDWDKDKCKSYLDDRDIPKNEIWDTLGRSGDCFCGCFGNPEEKLDLRAFGADYHAEWIEDLEDTVETGDKTETWAWGAFSDKEQRGLDAENDNSQMTLCSSCGVSYPQGDD
ncbi:phosphoadenosine phosphosulfate reductase [Haloferax tailed virus 1]|uniref:Phosphoadenosine phosphosulfate reductase n=1 Tax=Haloferax tailed virus 1 TaxID=2507575 RepID=A0A410N6U1_HFTV1|nr:phosphoadenosine phosphosulfate reductase [Haloferax tailed virus 1]QAS68891.1 phosphoadenosine phosphosulfate reductase [Haloferax tailed virus 1]